jgi:hypothetical protein
MYTKRRLHDSTAHDQAAGGVLQARAAAGRRDVADRGSPSPWRKVKFTRRVDPDFGSTLTASNRDSQSKCWVNWKIVGQPCEFQVRRVHPPRAPSNVFVKIIHMKQGGLQGSDTFGDD